MSLRFFSDQCVPAEITDTLRQHGHQVTLLREVLPIRSPDPAVIAKAQDLGAVLVCVWHLATGRDIALRCPRPRAAGGKAGLQLTLVPRLHGAGTTQRGAPTSLNS